VEVEVKLGPEALAQFDQDIDKVRKEADLAEKKEINRQETNSNSSVAFAQITEVDTSDTTTSDSAKENVDSSQDQDENKINAIPINELAPAPSRAQIYGHMFALMEESQEAEAKIKKMEDDAKERSNQALKDKLAARRRRKLD